MKKRILILIGVISIFSIQFIIGIITPLETPSWFYKAENEFISVDISADGAYIVAGTDDGYVYLFEKSNPNPIQVYNIGDFLWNLEISSDGKYIIAGQYTERFFLLDRFNSTPLWDYQIPGGSGVVIHAFSISPDGQYIVVSALDTIYLFNRTSSTPIWNSTLNSPSCSAFSSNGDYLVIGVNFDKWKVYGFHQH